MHKAKRGIARATEKVQGVERKKLILWCTIVLAGALIMLGLTAVILQSSRQDMPASITVSGELVCLPHKNNGGVRTLECAYGLHTDDGHYYGLKQPPTPVTQYPIGTRLQVVGTLESNPNSIYDVAGDIMVSSISR